MENLTLCTLVGAADFYGRKLQWMEVFKFRQQFS